MKILVTLSVVQTAGIALIAFLLLRDHAPQEAVGVPVVATGSRAFVSAGEHLAPQPQELQLRELIRKEIAAANAPQSTAKQASPPRDMQAEQRQRDSVAQQIEMYRSIGAIDDGQMSELHELMATLDDESRRSMLSKLIRAMNAGEIKGRF